MKPISAQLDVWTSTRGGEVITDQEKGTVTVNDERDNVTYTVPLEPGETLTARLREALTEAKSKPKEVQTNG